MRSSLKHKILIILLSLISLKLQADSISPSFISADLVEYSAPEEFYYLIGAVKFKGINNLISADKALYDAKDDLIYASGNVVLYDAKNRISLGESVILKDHLSRGIITNYITKLDDGLLTANFAEKSEQKILLHKASFTPCHVATTCNPIWEIGALDTNIDLEKHTITYHNAFFKVLGVPVFFTPYFAHPTPDAPAKSGLLVPSVVKDSLKIPIYYRYQPNLDFTISPRISQNAIIYEAEMRHKIEIGSYIIKDNYGYVPYKNKRTHSNYFMAKGVFGKEFHNYGFDLNFVSDKAFLKNYYDKHQGYLTSKLYLSNIENYNYYLLDALHFRDLNSSEQKIADPLIAPKLETKNIFELNDEKNLFFITNSDSLIYRQKNNLDILRTSVLFSLLKNSALDSGHLFSIDLSSRQDIYLYRKLNKDHTALRNIPQIQVTWRYPLAASREDDQSIVLEPIVSGILSPIYNQSSVKKFALIDPFLYELSENNIFSDNRYGGIDYHEMGARLSYGVNTDILMKERYLNAFIGQLIHQNNKQAQGDNIQNIGAINFSLPTNISMFYKYRKGKDLAQIRDEVGFSGSYKKLSWSTSLIRLDNINKYYVVNSKNLSKNHLTQANYNIDYQLTETISIGNEMQFDIRKKHFQLIYKSIRVTYFKDCVRIGAVFHDDYTFDTGAGIRKNSSKSFSIGLKMLNM